MLDSTCSVCEADCWWSAATRGDITGAGEENSGAGAAHSRSWLTGNVTLVAAQRLLAHVFLHARDLLPNGRGGVFEAMQALNHKV